MGSWNIEEELHNSFAYVKFRTDVFTERYWNNFMLLGFLDTFAFDRTTAVDADFTILTIQELQDTAPDKANTDSHYE